MRAINSRDEALTNIVKSVLKSCGRNEIILVEPLVRKTGRKSREEMLGWGVPSEVTLLTPVLIEFLRSKEFLDFWKEAGKSAIKAIAEHLGAEAVKQFTSKHATRLDTETVRLLRDAFAARLKASGFVDKEAMAASDHLISVLADHPDWAQALVT